MEVILFRYLFVKCIFILKSDEWVVCFSRNSVVVLVVFVFIKQSR